MDFWQSKFRIGTHEFSRFISGPLDGITDSPFRRLIRSFSPNNLLYTEMRHVNLIAQKKAGAHALSFDQLERPINFQVAANGIENIPAVCEKIEAAGVDMVDLNIGCPAKNVTGSGSGSALMADIPRLTLILKTFRSSLSIPFTVKIRAGFVEKNAVDVALLAQDCGVDALAIHPRLRGQKFNGQPDYELAAAVKKALSIPVIFSGGVVNFKLAQMVYERTGVDAFLIGRGIWGRPWKLHELEQAAQGVVYKPEQSLIYETARQHFAFMAAHYGSRAVYMFRKHAPFYIRGFDGASALRTDLMNAQEIDAVQALLSRLSTHE